ncbi:hypothetical protein FWD07_01360 [Candidatus Saccharibacteria bacterium]|nr:hypothetical protein [Candidatus Saccharibacteria bacterium]
MNPDENTDQMAPEGAPEVVADTEQGVEVSVSGDSAENVEAGPAMKVGQSIDGMLPGSGSSEPTVDRGAQEDGPADGGAAVVAQDVQAAQPEAPITPAGGKKSKGALAIILAIVGVLLIGGGVAAFFIVNNVLNSDERILGDALMNTLRAEEMTVRTTTTVDADDVSLTMTADIASRQDAMHMDTRLEVDMGGLAVRGGLELNWQGYEGWNEPGDLYFRTRDIGSLLELSVPELGGVADLLDEWVVVRGDMMTDLQEEIPSDVNDAMQCLMDVSQTIRDKDVARNIVDVFSEEDFLGIERDGEEEIGGRRTLKYSMRLNDRAMRRAMTAFEATDLYRAMNRCIEDFEDDADIDTDLMGMFDFDGSVRLNLWIDRSAREPVKMEMRHTSEDGTEILFVAEIELGVAEIPGAPSGAIDLEDYIEELVEVVMDAMFFGGMGGMLDFGFDGIGGMGRDFDFDFDLDWDFEFDDFDWDGIDWDDFDWDSIDWGF